MTAEVPIPLVRRTVRDVLTASPAFAELDPERRRALAEAMVKVCGAAAALILEESRSGDAVRAARPMATAQAAGDDYSGATAQRVAGVTQAVLNAVSFPRFVTDLITGVFKAMVDSSLQQMQAFVELLQGVATSVEGFADANLAPDQARAWLAEHYPSAFEVGRGDPDDEEAAGTTVLQLREGASPPSAETLRGDLGIAAGDPVPGGDPEDGLVAFARRHLARNRQSMLATMVTMGLQRIVIESGRINASMRFHIDTRSIASEDRGSRVGVDNRINVAGSFGAGPWGVSAGLQNTISYVSTQRNQSSEEMNTDLELNSGVDLYFKSDYVPLDRLANRGQIANIHGRSLNPAATDTARQTAQRAEEAARRGQVDTALKPPPPPEPLKPGDAGTIQDANAANKRAKDEEAKAEKADAAKKDAEKAEAAKKDAEKAEAAKKDTTKPEVKKDAVVAEPNVVAEAKK